MSEIDHPQELEVEPWLDAENAQRILRERAKALAQQPEQQASQDSLLKVVAFTLSGETYCFETSLIGEIFNLKELTPVPCTPAFVAGVVNLRGEIVTVVDMTKFLGLPSRGIVDMHQIITLRDVADAAMRVGVLADALIGDRTIPFDEMQTSLPTLSGINADFLKGIAPDGAIVLDARKILSDKRLIVDESE